MVCCSLVLPPVTWAGAGQGAVGTHRGQDGEWGLWASPQDLRLTTEGPAGKGDAPPTHTSSDHRHSEKSVTTLPPTGPSRCPSLSGTPRAGVGSGLGGGGAACCLGARWEILQKSGKTVARAGTEGQGM